MADKKRSSPYWYIEHDGSGPILLDTVVVSGKHQLVVSGGGGGGGGDATAANQVAGNNLVTAGNALLTLVDGKLPALSGGRLPTTAVTTPAAIAAVTGNITAVAGTLAADVASASNVTMHVTGTFAGHNCTFEASIDGGTTWFGVQAVRTNANTIEATTGVLGAAPAYAWELSVNSFTNVRVRATAHTSGTAAWRIQPSSMATEPGPAVPVHGVTQSGTWNIGTVTTVTAAAATTTPANGTSYNAVSAASTNATSVKASAGNLFEITASNVTATATFVKLYNKASAPTVGTDVPVLTISVPANTTVAMQFGSQGKRFATGIALAVTAAAAATDTAAAVAGVQLNATYI